MSDVAADALVVKGEILVEYAKPYGLNRNPNVNLASLGIMMILQYYIIIFHLSVSDVRDVCDVRAGGHGKPFDPS